jgi:ABC-type polysaccharide transport system permease subunit
MSFTTGSSHRNWKFLIIMSTNSVWLKNDIPYATAVSVTKTFISVFLVYITNALSKKINGQSVL